MHAPGAVGVDGHGVDGLQGQAGPGADSQDCKGPVKADRPGVRREVLKQAPLQRKRLSGRVP